MTTATTKPLPRGPDTRAAELVLSARQHYTSGRFREAEAICRQVLDENGEYGVALHLLGLIAGRTGRLAESAEFLRRAVKSCPNTSEFRSDLGVTLERIGDLAGAISCYRRVLALYGVGWQDTETGGHGDKETEHSAFSIQNSALSQTPTNLANALLHNGQIDEAKEACDQALRLNPGYAPAHNALGCILLEKNQAREACEAFRRAIELWPKFNEAKSNLGRALLTLGEFQEGWHYFAYLHANRVARHAGRKLGENNDECGMMNDECAPAARAEDKGPMTKDKELSGRTVFLYGEGGLGNIIQFARYATLLAQRGARIVFESPACLVNLLKTVPGIDQLIADGVAPPTYHAHASIMDLPRIFGTTLDSVPAAIPYLSAKPELVRCWGERLDSETRNPNVEIRNNLKIEKENDRNSGAGLEHSDLAHSNLFRISDFDIRASRSRRVGICWQAEQRTAYGRQRTIPLGHFAVLSQVPHVRLISLQKGWSGHAAFPISVMPGLDEAHGAFMDSAAIMKHLDLVITADTSIAHLAGALGVPVWVAVRYVPDWRWMLNRVDSPWYPTMRLFRQSKPGIWRDVFEEMAKELGKWIK